MVVIWFYTKFFGFEYYLILSLNLCFCYYYPRLLTLRHFEFVHHFYQMIIIFLLISIAIIKYFNSFKYLHPLDVSTPLQLNIELGHLLPLLNSNLLPSFAPHIIPRIRYQFRCSGSQYGWWCVCTVPRQKQSRLRRSRR